MSRTQNVTLTLPQSLTPGEQSEIKVFSSRQGGSKAGAYSLGASGSLANALCTFDPALNFQPGEVVTAVVPGTMQYSGTNAGTVSKQVTQFTVATTGGGAFYTNAPNHATGTQPAAITPADLDGDGDLDFVTADAGAGTLSVWRNGGTGTFTAWTTLTVGNEPRAVVAADVDRDGDLDLLAALTAADKVRILLNNGSGTFTFSADMSVGDAPHDVVVGDLDGDADLDFATANVGGLGISVCLNTGSGAFGAATSYSIGITASGLAMGDVDNDGDLDILAANQPGSSVLMYLNDTSNGTFGTLVGVTVDANPIKLALGDVNGDTRPDLLTANTSGTVSVCLNTGGSSFGSPTNLSIGGAPYGLTLGDIDGDHDLDLAVADNTNNRVALRMNDGSGTFSGSTTVSVGTNPRAVALADVTGDGTLDLLAANYGAATATVRFNPIMPPVINALTPAAPSVGNTVVVTGLYLGNATSVTLNGTSLSFTPISTTQLSFVVPVGAVSGPVDVTTSYGTGGALLLVLPGITSFSPSTGVAYGSVVTLTGTSFSGVTAVDFNGVSATSYTVNSTTSITATVPAGAPSGPVNVTTGAGTGSSTDDLTVYPAAAVSLSPTRHARGVALAARPAVTYSVAQAAGVAPTALKVFGSQRGLRAGISAGGGTTTTTFYPNAGFRGGERVQVTSPGTFGGVWEFYAAASATGGAFGSINGVGTMYSTDVEMGDLDNDGDLDMVTITQGNTTSTSAARLRVALNNGSGTFAAPTEQVIAATYLVDLVLADMDNDGYLDAVTTGLWDATNSAEVRVMLGNHSGGFSLIQQSFFSSNNFARLGRADVGDVDGDGDLDVLLTHQGYSSIGINDGDGYLTVSQVSGQFVGVTNNNNSKGYGALRDMDNDGDLDLIWSGYNSPTFTVGLVQVYRNTGSGTYETTPVTSLLLGDEVFNIIADDFDGDGDADVLACYEDNSTYLLRNDGTGTLTAGANLGFYTGWARSMDFDGDGDRDVFSGTGNLYRNDGTGAFTAVALPQSGIAGIGDVDGDGDEDFVIPNTTSPVYLNHPAPSISTFSPQGSVGALVVITGQNLNNATAVKLNGVSVGTFTVVSATEINFYVPAGATSGPLAVTTPWGTATTTSFTVVLASTITGLNPARNASAAPRAGHVTLTLSSAPTSATQGNIRVFGSRSGGLKTTTKSVSGTTLSLNPATDFAPGEQVWVTAPGTVTTEANAFLTKQVYQFTAAAPAGQGVFQASTAVSPALGSVPNSVALGDLDGDGDADLVTANSSDDNVSVRFNNGSGTFTGSTNVGAGSSPGDVKLADVDADGDLDMLVATKVGTGAVNVRLNNGSGTFTNGTDIAMGGRSQALAVADFDGDGDLDLASGFINASFGFGVVLNNGTGTFGAVTTYNPSNLETDALAAADVDSDGDVDLLLGIGGTGTVRAYLNNSAGTFTAGGSVTGLGGVYGLATGDVDADGDLDVLVGRYNGTSAHVLTNNGTGTFALATSVEMGGTTTRVALGDLNGDGTLDLAASRSNTGIVAVALNTAGTFGATTAYVLGSSASGFSSGTDVLTLADVDADDDLDLVAVASTSATLRVGLNQNGLPTLSSFTPTSGPEGTSVTVSGTSLAGTTSVKFNGVSATFTVNSSLQLTATVPAGATTGPLSVTTPNGTATSSTSFTVTPFLTSFSPVSGAEGATVVLTGTSLTGASSLTFNGVSAGFTVNSATQITATVPAGATTGVIRVTTLGGTFTTTASFAVTPAVLSFSPGSGAAGTVVTLSGTTFTGATAVSFNGVAATFTVNSAAQITATVPAAASTGLISVTTVSGPGSSASNFIVTPAVASFSPTSGPAGTTVVLTGTALTGATALTFNGEAATFTVNSATQITATIPAAATTGALQVTTPAGSFTTSGSFTVTPAILSFLPASGPAGTVITLSGTTLAGATSVTLNGLALSFAVVNSTSITATVPAAASTGLISVTTASGTGSSTGSFVVTFPVTAVAPTRHAVSAARAADVTLTFPEPAAAASLANVRVFGNQRGGRRTGTVSGSGNTLTFNPGADFLPGETVSVSLPAAVTNGSGTAATPHVYQFTAAAGAAPGGFGLLSTLSVGSQPNGTALADLDHDGDLDLAVAVLGDAQVKVYFNSGAGGFGAGTAYATGVNPQNVAAADVDNDGDLDLLTANTGVSSSVSVLRNDGAGTFVAAAAVPVGTLPALVVAADVNGDGWLDVLTPNRISPASVSVALNLGTGAGTFAAASSLTLPASPQHLAVGDLDHDGDLDLALADDTRVRLAFNNGAGSFSLGSSTITVGTNPRAVALADVNADGYLDVLTTNSGSASISVALATGAGTFATASSVSVNASPYALTTSDVDGDGDPDLVCTHSSSTGSVSVRLNDGAGTFSGTNSVSVGAAPFGLSLGDLDGNLTLDLVTADRNGSTVSVLLNVEPPLISSFAPTSGPEGTLVTITGSGLTNTTAVKFNGTAAPSFAVVNSTTVTATVPAGATTGTISLTALGNTTTSAGSFTVTPALSSFTPTSGPAGTVVILTGTSFSGATAVTFNGVAAASYTVNSATQITATAPAGVSTGPLAVTTGSATATSSGSFTVPVPVVTSFTPTSGVAGTSVVITGTSLSGATAVTFNGVAAASYVVNSATQITAVAPAGVSTGPLAVTTGGGTGTSSSHFAVLPTISTFSPASAGPGAVVTLTGLHFTGATAVRFNGTAAASFTVVNGTEIQATVPNTATTGTLSVTTAAGTATSSTAFTMEAGISSFSPTSGPVGTTVYVSGSGLSGATALHINGTASTNLSATANALSARVGTGATTGPLTVTAAGGAILTAPGTFTVTTNTVAIQSLSATSGSEGFQLRVFLSYPTGSPPTSVTVNGVATPIVSLSTFNVGAITSSAILRVQIPVGATGTGYVTVSNAHGTSQSGQTYTILPALNSFSPTSGPEGTAVTLTGTTLTGATALTLNGTSVPFTVVNSNTLTTAVPVGATSGSFQVTTATGTATSGSFAVLSVYNSTLNQCLTTGSITSTGANTWQYLLAPNGQLVAALKDGGQALGTVYAEFAQVSQAAVRADATGKEYLDRNWHLVAQNTFAGHSVEVKFYGLNTELARYMAANDGDGNDVDAPSGLRLTQYAGSNENCALADNGTPTELRLLTPSATETLNGATWFAVITTIADHFSEFYLSGGNTPLPVELTSFTAGQQGRSVQLKWVTASELNSAWFAVERSADGRTFEPIGRVAAQGSSSSPTSYAWTDSQVPESPSPEAALYYRLRQADLDGTSSYSPVRTVRRAGVQELALFPNPASGAATLTGAVPGAAVQVFDGLGRVVATAKADAAGTATLVLPAQLGRGLYLVRAGAHTTRLVLK